MLRHQKKMFLRFLTIVFIFFSHPLSSSSIPNTFEKNDYVKILTSMLLTNKTVSNDCITQILSIRNALTDESHLWALKMIDATAKPQSGLLMGNTIHMGNYDECLEIDENFNGEQIQGKYCRASFQPHPQHGQLLKQQLSKFGMNFSQNNDPSGAMRLLYGVCVPKICTARDLQDLVDILENENNFPLHFHFMDDLCDTKDREPFTTGALIVIAVFSIFGAILVASTLYEVFFYAKLNDAEKRPNLFIAFSVITNGKRLLSTSTTKNHLDCLNGFRVISIMWVVWAHLTFFSIFLPNVNAVHIFAWKNAFKNAFILGSPVAVDTFFTISGLLVVYLFMKSQAKGVKFSLPMFYCHRILRLTPSLVMVLLLTTTLLKYMGNGPLWPEAVERYQKPCERNWWSTLMYLEKHFNGPNECLRHTWYLSVDTQMYFLSPIILFPLVKWPSQTIRFILVLIILSCCYVFGLTWQKRFGSTFFHIGDYDYDYIYGRTYVRGTAYLIGMICGYFVYKTSTSQPLKLRKFYVMVLWISSSLSMFGILLAHTAMTAAPEYNVLKTALFNSLTRVGWSVSLSIIIFLCANGYGGLVNSFLSSKIFTVLIRLNYNVYLLHTTLIVVFSCQSRVTFYFANMQLILSASGYYIVTICVAFVWTLAFEAPVMVIEKLIFGRLKNTDLRGFNDVAKDDKSL